jgi:hypothetical protein
LTPHVINKPIEGNNAIGHQEQAKDERATAAAGNSEGVGGVVTHLEWTEN